MRCYYLKIDDDELFNNRSKRPTFVLSTLKSMLNFKAARVYTQQPEYKMYCTDYPIDYIFLNGIFWSP